MLAVGAFALLFSVIVDLSHSARVTGHAEKNLASADRMERLLTDLETGVRGYAITGNTAYLRQWDASRSDLQAEGLSLRRLAAGSGPEQAGRAEQLVRESTAYVRDYSVPLVTEVRNKPSSKLSLAAIKEGEERLTRIQSAFDRFSGVERRISDTFKERSDNDARHATMIAAAGTGGALLLIVLLSGYLTRAVLRPARRASEVACEVAAGDLSVRTPETSHDEMGVLEHVFNTMARSLQRSQHKLQRAADEQGSLRRVATLIGRDVSPIKIFTTVASELGRIKGADYTQINRFDPDGMATVVGHWNPPGAPVVLPPLNGRWPIEEGTAAIQVLRTGEPARVTHDYSVSEIGTWTREHGMHQVVGCPITVGGRLWGMATILSRSTESLPDETEPRMLAFVELLATAIANAQNRSELLASHTRIVAASDEVRRRIERSLRDVVQYRLVALQCDLRAAQARVPEGHDEVSEQVAKTVRGLSSVLDDLQEITRGLHPATLIRDGLTTALEALTQRSRVPVDLDAYIDRRLSGHVELAIYYTVSEALTNVAKYSRASKVRVDLGIENRTLRLMVHDDGIGGADPARGSGLNGLKERVEALGGRLRITSPRGDGTSLLVRIPIEAEPPEEAGRLAGRAQE